MLNRHQAPLLQKLSAVKVKEVESIVFNNGLHIYSINSSTQPVVKLEVLFPTGGNYYEIKPGTSMLCLYFLKEGTLSYNSREIANALAYYGAQLQVNPSFDAPSIGLLCLSKHIHQLLPYLKEILMSPVFPENEFDSLKRLHIQNLKTQQKKNNVQASKHFRNSLYGNDNPYGKLITIEDLENVTIQDIKEFYQLNLQNFELLMSGDVAGLLPVLESTFKDYQNSIADFKPFKDFKIQSTKTYSNAIDSSVQTSIRVGKRFIPKTNPDYHKVYIANHILGGYFGSRLMKNIREDKGYTYGIYSSLVNLQYDSYLIIASDVIKESVEDSLYQINKEILDLKNNLITLDELDTVKQHLIGSFQSGITTPFSLISKFKNIHMYGLDYDFYENHISTIQSITLEDLKETYNQYFDESDMTTVSVG
ncbi:M16 family metallopeptidase [Fulvivirga ligni]|uniref:M16 family metallopeptidase n=1 Tax=Fulvivirga ligni TaxID=2904246 RepID=UPI001F48629C|nr:pitrilysin family protein [Fulvivirga ligni]UII21970.1 insulinase family protein [Fulvivirga ligni]